ncbi:MAG: MBL fold metallo-hydrolase, partial [Calditrichia bacterium]
MVVYPMTLGLFAVNNFLVYSEETSRAILIDACEDSHSILNKISELNLELVYLINTHGHGDHIAGNERIVKETGAKLMVHPVDRPYLSDPNLNLSVMLGGSLHSPEPHSLLNEGDVVELDDIRLQVIHTPGHTPGHITL